MIYIAIEAETLKWHFVLSSIKDLYRSLLQFSNKILYYSQLLGFFGVFFGITGMSLQWGLC
jgi:hypothetical protein